MHDFINTQKDMKICTGNISQRLVCRLVKRETRGTHCTANDNFARAKIKSSNDHK